MTSPYPSDSQDFQRPLILVSNDDGIEAPGVHRLIDCIADFGDIVCVCPDSARSGQSMALSVSGAMRLRRLPDYNGAQMWATNGTPTDCVKLAMHALVDRCPDMVISGINHGSNAAINVLYSGTMGAAMEGCAFGIPSIGFSLTSHDKKADFGGCRPFIRKIVSAVMQNGLPDEVCLNVNIPYQEQSPRRLRLVRQCKGNWRDEYKEYTDPTGKPFFMMSGYFENEEPEATDTDEWCLANNIVSVVPVLLDRTAPLPPPLQQGGQPEAGEEPSQSGSLTARRLQFLRSLEPLDIM